jgi:excisionase family DNA binding protein
MADLFDPKDLISQAEAAKLRGVSRASINELVTRGRLKTVEIGGKPFLYRAEVKAFEPDKGGRPPKSSLPATQKKAVTGAAGTSNGTSTKRKGGKK